MVHGTKGVHKVRIVRGTNSQWYEKSSNHHHREHGPWVDWRTCPLFFEVEGTLCCVPLYFSEGRD